MARKEKIGKKLAIAQVKELAENLLLDFKELPGFESAQISDIQPVYDIREKNITYYEVKYSSQKQRDNGYAIISASREDLPVVEFSATGPTHYERFKRLTKVKHFRMVRFSPVYITAEDSKGELLAEIGLRPALIPKRLQKHIRREGRAESSQVKLLKTPKVDLGKVSRKGKLLDYKTYKLKFNPPLRDRAKIQKEWTHALKPRGNPGCNYDFFWADGYGNHPYYLQIPKNTHPNNNDHSSGCGANAWMNLFGWHDLNWTEELLPDEHKYNDGYINEMTMKLHDYLGTFAWPFSDQGFTWPDDMTSGYNFARIHLINYSGYSYRHDWWNTDENWVFQVARDMARRKRPFIVGYFQDTHYAIGCGIAECRTHGWRDHGWIYIYPAWNTNDNGDKWIPKGTIFGIWGIYNFVGGGGIRLIANIAHYSRELHLDSCYWVTRMNSRNKKLYYSLEKGLQDGFDGCAFCLPQYHTR